MKESFSNEEGFLPLDGGYIDSFYQNGSFHMWWDKNALPAGRYMNAMTPVGYLLESPLVSGRDYSIAIDVTLIQGTDGAAQLYFDSDEFGTWHVFQINPAQQLATFYHYDAVSNEYEYSGELVVNPGFEGDRFAEIMSIANSSRNGVSRIEVRKIGNRYHFMVNGQEIASARADSTAGDQFGFGIVEDDNLFALGQPYFEVAFDNLVVEHLD